MTDDTTKREAMRLDSTEAELMDRYFVAALMARDWWAKKPEKKGFSEHRIDVVKECWEIAAEGLRQRKERIADD